ncbi:unnamed protein product, partial [Didymodactylos carnosus]
MLKAISVGLLFLLCLSFTFGYPHECAHGPEYWCKTFVTASECGALRHCTDTVWKYQQYESEDESTTCDWCKKILEKSSEAIGLIENNDALVKSTLLNGCQLFPYATISAQCTTVMTTYLPSVLVLLKNHRFHTLCRLMKACDVQEQKPELPESITQKQILVGGKRCTWGPSYWCSSLQNAHECQSVKHCSTKVWPNQLVNEKDNICQYCEFALTKLRRILETNETEITVDKYLAGACSMLPTKELIDQCVKMLTDYSEQLLVLLRTNMDPGVICHLVHMCKDSTIVTRTEIKEQLKVAVIVNDEDSIQEIKSSLDEETKMLCPVLVRATADLFNEGKQQKEIQMLNRDDCKKLQNIELVQKCVKLVDTYQSEIYRHVMNRVELSKICGLVYSSSEKEQQIGQVTSDVECELCTVVTSIAKRMLETKHSEDNVIRYIEQEMCSRLQSLDKKACQNLLQEKGREMLNSLTSGTHPMLLCTHFKVCLTEISLPSSPLQKEEIIDFLKNDICKKLGVFKDVCDALIDKEGKNIIQLLINDVVRIIHFLGLCPKLMTFLDNLAVHDDKNKCKRCIDDFTRRKHISERLITKASEFMKHLCGQLPQKDECEKQVDASVNDLLKYIQSLDPQSICVELKMCDKTTALLYKPDLLFKHDVVNMDSVNCTLCRLAFDLIKKALQSNATEEQILDYIKTDICKKLPSLDKLCERLINAEGPKILELLAGDIDPHKVCQIIGICPNDQTILACKDKCECCVDKVESYESKATSFIQSMVSSMKTFCGHLPVSEQCSQMVDNFSTRMDSYISSLDSKRICQTLRFCPTGQLGIEMIHDRCPHCQDQLESKRKFLLSSVDKISDNLKSLCDYTPWDKDCQSVIDRSMLTLNEKIEKINPNEWCLKREYCPKTLTSKHLERQLENYLKDEICSKGDESFQLLCKQLVSFDEKKSEMEALFKSILNRNGQLEGSELCEFDEENNDKECKPNVEDLKDCNDKCDCCVKLYKKKKTYNLKQIETLRSGLLATCDWSSSKTQCTNWFNRVCDRMRTKVDQSDSENFCKRIGLCSSQINTPIAMKSELIIVKTENDEQKCKSADKCECCVDRIQQRTNRLKLLINHISCDNIPWNKNCKNSVTREQQRSLNEIEKIEPQQICQHLGFCSADHSSLLNSHSEMLVHTQYSQLDSLNERLGVYKKLNKSLKTYIQNEVCLRYGQLAPLCKHIIGSVNSMEYEKVYLALLTKNTYYIRQDVDEKLAEHKRLNIDVCQGCKDVVQATKDFWTQAIETVRSSLLHTCDWCPVKDECRDFYTRTFDYVKDYLDKIDPEQWCQATRLCPTSSVTVTGDRCEQCTSRLQNRKDCFIRTIDRLTSYFDDLCQRFADKQCQNFVKEQSNRAKEWVQMFDPKETCQHMGFCTMISNDNEYQQDRSFDEYEKQFQSRIEDEICSKLGPFNSICRQVARGNMKEVQTTKINLNIKDLVELGEKNIFTAKFLNECSNDKCGCCVKHIKCKIAHAKELTHELTETLTSLCDYCPVKRRCKLYFEKREEQFDKCLDYIKPRHACTKAGFCPNKTEEETLTDIINVVPSHIDIPLSNTHLCDKMGPFAQACKEVLGSVSQFGEKMNLIEDYLPKASVNLISTVGDNSNQTCIMCEFVMNLLKSYITKKSTEQQIEQSLDRICQEMPSSLKQECLLLIENYSPAILSVLAQEFDPKSVCQKLRICTKELSQRLSTEHLTKASLSSCGICDYFSTYLHFAIQRDSSETAVQKALQTVCTHLVVDKRMECETLLALYTPQIVSHALKLDMGNNFCKELKICQTPMIELSPGIKTPAGVVHVPLTRVQ